MGGLAAQHRHFHAVIAKLFQPPDLDQVTLLYEAAQA
jgi:hypothetical protein